MAGEGGYAMRFNALSLFILNINLEGLCQIQAKCSEASNCFEKTMLFNLNVSLTKIFKLSKSQTMLRRLLPTQFGLSWIEVISILFFLSFFNCQVLRWFAVTPSKKDIRKGTQENNKIGEIKLFFTNLTEILYFKN